MPDQGFGKFKSVGEFLRSYKAAEEREQAEVEKELPFEERVLRRRGRARSVVEVSATLHEREPNDTDGDQHVRLLITVKELLEGDSAVNDDVERVLSSGEDVFVAIRIGDSMGITETIKGLDAGAGLDLKGEWIPKSRATAHGGRAMSVLHFTHHTVGFICVDEPAACYS
jgi:endonuclease G, mitochondrial